MGCLQKLFNGGEKKARAKSPPSTLRVKAIDYIDYKQGYRSTFLIVNFHFLSYGSLEMCSQLNFDPIVQSDFIHLFKPCGKYGTY